MADWWKIGRIYGALGLGGLGGAAAYWRASGIKDESKRKKNEIEDAYSIAQQRMAREHGFGTQSNNESLAARGLLNGGGPIRRTISGNVPSNLAEQSSADLQGQFGLDRRALDNAHDQAIHQNKADTINAYIGMGTQAIGAATSMAGVGADLGSIASLSTAPAATQQSPIASALLSASSFQGIHPNDPLNDNTSSWYLPRDLMVDGNGTGTPNANFHTQEGVG